MAPLRRWAPLSMGAVRVDVTGGSRVAQPASCHYGCEKKMRKRERESVGVRERRYERVECVRVLVKKKRRNSMRKILGIDEDAYTTLRIHP